MRCLLILLCLMFATSVANAEHIEPWLHGQVLKSHKTSPKFIQKVPMDVYAVQLLKCHEPLPEFIRKAPLDVYAVWAKLHNRVALTAAYAKHDRRGYVIPPTTVTTKQYREYSTATGGRGFFSLPTHYESNRSERTITRTYSRDTWSGGPVLLINPYFRN